MSRRFPKIAKLETFVIGQGGEYSNQKDQHWNVKGDVATPMDQYPEWDRSRGSWGFRVLGVAFVKVIAEDGTVGFCTGLGGPPACWLIKEHFTRFVVGQDPRDTNKIWDQMFRSSMFYGRKGLPLMAISLVDLAIWDLLGKIRGEPVYKMIGGATTDDMPVYLTGPHPEVAKELGFCAAKVTLPFGPSAGQEGLRRNVEHFKRCREAIGPNYELRVDCFMSLTVPYAIALFNATKEAGITLGWWEEVLIPDDIDGHKLLKQACPDMIIATGEHEYTK